VSALEFAGSFLEFVWFSWEFEKK